VVLACKTTEARSATTRSVSHIYECRVIIKPTDKRKQTTDMETVVLKSNTRVWETTDSESTDNEGLLYFGGLSEGTLLLLKV
jgi:hypothetical protein